MLVALDIAAGSALSGVQGFPAAEALLTFLVLLERLCSLSFRSISIGGRHRQQGLLGSAGGVQRLCIRVRAHQSLQQETRLDSLGPTAQAQPLDAVHHSRIGQLQKQICHCRKHNTAQGHGNDVSPEPVGVEAKLFEDALPANSQRGQHAAVERACEEERRGRLVEFVDCKGFVSIIEIGGSCSPGRIAGNLIFVQHKAAKKKGRHDCEAACCVGGGV
mmetsp:Transcript_8742/g.26152  ORF Transcript_8742/g.26152 Transcript_8742/m.26152 type:complete len:218 (-) Transcript_8742:517-1170(-)